MFSFVLIPDDPYKHTYPFQLLKKQKQKQRKKPKVKKIGHIHREQH